MEEDYSNPYYDSKSDDGEAVTTTNPYENSKDNNYNYDGDNENEDESSRHHSRKHHHHNIQDDDETASNPDYIEAPLPSYRATTYGTTNSGSMSRVGQMHQNSSQNGNHQNSGVSSPKLPLPPIASVSSVAENQEINFVPYKYTVDSDKGIFRIFTRSTCGNMRKVFTMDVQSWSYLDIPTGLSNPQRTVSILCEEMSTDRVSFDPNTNHFIVEPSEAVTQKVREATRTIVRVPLTSFSVLSRYGHRFFDLLHENGRWVKRVTPNTSSSPNSSEPSSSSGSSAPQQTTTSAPASSATTKVAFQTLAWTVIDSGTLSFLRNGGKHNDESHPIVNVWTTYSSFGGSQHTSSAIASLISNLPSTSSSISGELVAPTIDISVKVFSSTKEIVSEFYALLRNEIDIAVHYGEVDSVIAVAIRKLLLSETVDGIAKAVTGTLELFDLKDYVKNVYTDMPSHDFKAIISEINIYGSDNGPATTTSSTESESSINLLTAAAASSLTNCAGDATFGTSSTSEFFLPDLKTTIHSHENIAFFLEKIAAKTFLLSRLYSKLSKSIFELSYLSGCNISSLTQREMTSRGVVAFIDPITAWSQIVDTLPYDYMKGGIHGLTHVTSLSNILVSNLCKSDHPLTVTIGKKISPLKAYGWIVREIFSMRNLYPVPLSDIQNVFGIFRGMVYSSEEIKGYEVARQWSSIINVGLSSWIGISMTVNADSSSPDENVPAITFGYFGIEDVCRHPFDAMRTAVEMYLSLAICSNTAASAKTVAMTTVLTPENMTIRRKITAANLSSFSSLLPPHEAALIAEGQTETTLKLWYRSNDKFTTNPLLADRKVYISMLENMLTQTFGFINAHIQQQQQQQYMSSSSLHHHGSQQNQNSNSQSSKISSSNHGNQNVTSSSSQRQPLAPPPPPSTSLMIGNETSTIEYTSNSHKNTNGSKHHYPSSQNTNNNISTSKLIQSHGGKPINEMNQGIGGGGNISSSSKISSANAIIYEPIQTVKVMAERDRIFPGVSSSHRR